MDRAMSMLPGTQGRSEPPFRSARPTFWAHLVSLPNSTRMELCSGRCRRVETRLPWMKQGTFYLAGGWSSVPITVGGTILTNRGAFVAKYDSTANPIWVRQVVGASLGASRALAMDGTNGFDLTGQFETN